MQRTQVSTGLRITKIQNQCSGASNTSEEWIRIVNDGGQRWDLRGWLITDETDRQINPHIFKLPSVLADGSSWTLDPGEALYLITGHGKDRFVAQPTSGPRQFHFFWNRSAFVWNNSGDRVYLRHPNGQFGTQPFPIP